MENFWMTKPETEELLQGIKTGDINAYAKIILEYSASVRAVLSDVLTDEDDIQESTYKTFADMRRMIVSGETTTTFEPWLMWLARDEALNASKDNAEVECEMRAPSSRNRAPAHAQAQATATVAQARENGQVESTLDDDDDGGGGDDDDDDDDDGHADQYSGIRALPLGVQPESAPKAAGASAPSLLASLRDAMPMRSGVPIVSTMRSTGAKPKAVPTQCDSPMNGAFPPVGLGASAAVPTQSDSPANGAFPPVGFGTSAAAPPQSDSPANGAFPPVGFGTNAAALRQGRFKKPKASPAKDEGDGAQQKASHLGTATLCVLVLLLAWVVVGLARQSVLPSIPDLGYAWFNTNICYLF